MGTLGPKYILYGYMEPLGKGLHVPFTGSFKGDSRDSIRGY